jgi:uncharacterized double-CXXCG motif protein
MISLFEVVRDDSNLGSGYIDATHKWGLPGVICSQCNSTWGAVGSEYPSVDLSGLSNENAYRKARAVPFDEFERLRQPILRMLPEGSKLIPGTQFGPLLGEAKGKFKDFAWINLWTLLIRSEVRTALETRVSNLICVRPQLSWKGVETDLLELQLDPHGHLVSPSTSQPSCEACGRDPNSLPKQIIVTRSSIPDNVDLFRARNFNTVLLATSRFVNAVRDLNLVGVRFNEVIVSD